jgi:hypothetical protein
LKLKINCKIKISVGEKMYKSLSSSILKEMLDRGRITVTIKTGWETACSWASMPSYITYCLGGRREHIFSFYLTRGPNTIQMINVESTKLISDKKPLVDAYMYVALRGVIDFAKSLKAKRFIFDSYIPSAADHMLDLGFIVNPKGFNSGGRGLKILKEMD